ncbi:hypothetical protein GN958_ATG12101 [Phytophthora infestans]|uniref:Reverse transcriptase zinc-binding domain-containing protein n=1 Tax=Phytophthora infestans TaxID=4787 RepID=A0A8S9UDL1_PHYIN|nr:hypothetical protein GN958_ATG12101 [Phytophthora infestans]
MIKSLQLHMLCKVILAGRTPPGTSIPSWADPVIRLFDQAVTPWGKDFDILYAPVSTSPDYVVSRRSTRWSALGVYWHFVLFIWHTLFRGKAARLQVKFDKLTTPLLDNVDIAYSYRGYTLAGTTRPLGLISVLAEQEILRPLELYRACETPVTAETLSQFLNQFVTGRISSVRSCANFLDKADRLLGSLKELPVGPSQTTRYYAAFHTWVFDTYEVAELSVARIRKVLAQYPVPDLPLNRLGVEGGPPKSMWTRDIKMGRHVLPVYSDLLYRLQHNALYVGYRLQHLQETQCMCHHGCGVLETAPHLFWYCDFAAKVWQAWLAVFQGFFKSTLEWESILLFKVEPIPSAKSRYGYSLFVMLHIVRTVVLRCLWMHRNDIRFHELSVNLIDVQAQVKAVVTLHVERYYQDLLLKTLSHSGFQRRHLRDLVSSLGLTLVLPAETDTEDAQLEQNTA